MRLALQATDKEIAAGLHALAADYIEQAIVLEHGALMAARSPSESQDAPQQQQQQQSQQFDKDKPE
jgi:hypothetical protein